ncbi:MAG: VOC family protein [Alphaproteobacteria bacterium]
MTTIPALRGAPIVQNAYVVNDLESACRRLHAIYGMGPFLGGGDSALGNHVYRGRASDPIEIRGVFVQSGDLNVELVEVRSNGPCAFTDLYKEGREGLHHVAVFCVDYEAARNEMVAAGYPVASEFEVGFGAKICYVDTSAALGHMIELYPEHEFIRAMYAQTREAAANWDGKQLIRPWDL